MSDHFELLDQAQEVKFSEMKKELAIMDIPEGLALLYIFLPKDQTRICTLFRTKQAPIYEFVNTVGNGGSFNAALHLPQALEEPNPQAKIALKLFGTRRTLSQLSKELTNPTKQTQIEFHRHVLNRLGFPKPVKPKPTPFDPFDL